MSEQTHWKQNFNYKYTGAYELAPGEEKKLVIDRLVHEEVIGSNGKKEKCFVAYFKGQTKPMVLNKTNCKTIAKLYGAFIEGWVNKAIIVCSRKVDAWGEEVEALRVKNVVPEMATVDTAALSVKLHACVSLDDLKSVYGAMAPAEKAAMLALKDELKVKLSQGVAA
jgi:hypothetical protein